MYSTAITYTYHYTNELRRMAPATIMSDSEFILGNGDNPVHNGEPRNKSEVEVATR